MYQCPTCGGGVRFDIASQKLRCDHCQNTYEPESFSTHGAAEEENEFSTTRFLCPQCGAEIIGDDNTAAAFCSFCGASTILESRISKEKRPDHIIPFKITKAQCTDLYTRMLRRSPFAPKALKDPKSIESFRGIYMPYWMYGFDYQGSFHVSATKSSRQGNYDITRYFDLSGNMDASFDGILHDASTTFSDDISESVVPYEINAIRDFHPAYLSGFYADTEDVNPNLYLNDADKLTQTYTSQAITGHPSFQGYHIDPGRKTAPDAVPRPAKYAMLPVWFMAYRKKDRVSYVTINGQTGKIAADIPIDPARYAIGSLLLAIPLFLLLNLLLSLSASVMLILSAIIAFITAIVAIVEHSHMQKKEHGDLDRGLRGYKTRKPPVKKSHSALDAFSPTLSFASVVAAIAIVVIDPVSDYWFYAGSLFSIVASFLAFTRIIRNYNILATRKLPQFSRTGGDDHA